MYGLQSVRVIMQNFVLIGQTVAEIWRLFDCIFFSNWRSSAIFDSFCARLDHTRRVFGGIYHCAKFGCNQYSNFDASFDI